MQTESGPDSMQNDPSSRSRAFTNSDNSLANLETNQQIKSRMENDGKFWGDFQEIENHMENFNTDLQKHLTIFERLYPKSNHEIIKELSQYENYCRNGFSNQKPTKESRLAAKSRDTLIKVIFTIDLNITPTSSQLNKITDCIERTFQKQMMEKAKQKVSEVVVILKEKPIIRQDGQTTQEFIDLARTYFVRSLFRVPNQKDVDHVRSICDSILNPPGGIKTSDFFVHLEANVQENDLEVKINNPNLVHESKVGSENNGDICQKTVFTLGQVTALHLKVTKGLKDQSKNKFGEILEKLKSDREKTLQPDEAKFAKYQKKYFKVKLDSDDIPAEYSESKYIERNGMIKMKRYNLEIQIKNLHDKRDLFIMNQLRDAMSLYWEYFKRGYELLKGFMEDKMPIMENQTDLKEMVIEKRSKIRREYLTKQLCPKFSKQKSQAQNKSMINANATGIRDLDFTSPVNSRETPIDQADPNSLEGVLYTPHPSWGPVKCKLSDGKFTVEFPDRRETKVFNVQLCSIKDKERELKLRFTFGIIDHTGDEIILQAECSEQKNQWTTTIQNAILEGLGTPKGSLELLTDLWKIDGNKTCADCGGPDPEWCSINLGLLICQNCASFHRNLGTRISKVRSLRLDKLLPGELIVVKAIGNNNGNKFWESTLSPEEKILTSTSNREIRDTFIHEKYAERHFIKGFSLTQEKKNKALHKACKQNDFLAVYRALTNGAEVNAIEHSLAQQSPLHFAVQKGDQTCIELLLLNGADVCKLDINAWIPLHYAAQCDNATIIQSLLKRKPDAQIYMRDKNGKTPLDICIESNGALSIECSTEGVSQWLNSHGYDAEQLQDYNGSDLRSFDIDKLTVLIGEEKAEDLYNDIHMETLCPGAKLLQTLQQEYEEKYNKDNNDESPTTDHVKKQVFWTKMIPRPNPSPNAQLRTLGSIKDKSHRGSGFDKVHRGSGFTKSHRGSGFDNASGFQAILKRIKSNIILEGSLQKTGSKNQRWRSRWFVLDGNNLFYYANKDASLKGEKCLGRIALDRCIIINDEIETSLDFHVQTYTQRENGQGLTKARCYALRAENANSKQKWMRELNTVIQQNA